jgi:hypothetical protein
MDDWEFYQDHDGRWFWRSIRGSQSSLSVNRFTSFVEAWSSAVQNGFNPGVSRIATVSTDRRFKPRSPPGPARAIH